MKILVTGGCGFIGSNFIRYWLKTHSQDLVVNLDKLTYAGHLSSTSDFEKNPRYRFLKGDILDSSTVEQALRKIDIVVHFAAESHVDRSILGPASFIRTNIMGTQVLLDAALKQKVKRFHHISTDEVFGSLALGNSDKFKETTPYNPRSPYSASKAGSDHIVRAYHDTFGLPISITNCSNNYGPFQDPEKFIPRAITNLLEGKKVPVYGDGKYTRDWLHVEDHCRAIGAVLTKGKVGETYCVGGQDHEINNLDIVKMILKLMKLDESKIEFVTDRPGHDRKYAVSWKKIQKQLGWMPTYSLKDGLNKTIIWFRNNKSWWEPLKKKSETIYKNK